MKWDKKFLQQLKNLYALSFEDTRQYINYFFTRKTSPDKVIYVKQNDVVCSALHLVDKQIYFANNIFFAPCIVAAATLPQLRGQKLMETVMQKAFNKLYGDGVCFTTLYPFNHNYYSKYGFATYAFNKKTSVVFDGNLKVETLEANESLLNRIYDKYCQGKQGYTVRTCETFAKYMSEWACDGTGVIAIKKDNTSCYAVYKDGEIGEACGDTSLLNAVQTLNGYSFEQCCEGSDGGNQLRIIDAKKLLTQIKYKNDGVLRFKLTDGMVPQNNGIFSLQIVNKKATLHKSDVFEVEFDAKSLAEEVFCENKPKATTVFPTLPTFNFDKF